MALQYFATLNFTIKQSMLISNAIEISNSIQSNLICYVHLLDRTKKIVE